MGNGKQICVAAGGTGGHLFPAQALAEELTRRGYTISLLTDERVRDYGKAFPAEEVHIVPSASLSLTDPLMIPRRALRLVRGYFCARALFGKVRPLAAVGFGGYPSLPPLLAAAHLHIPAIVHEQNAVLGRANRFLSHRVNLVATSFEKVRGFPQGLQTKIQLTGNPVREVVRSAAGRNYQPHSAKGEIRILIFGGSQGARFFSDLLPSAFSQLPVFLRQRLAITQQCRPEDVPRVRTAYKDLGIAATLASFFANLPEIMAQSHLVICRSGASTIAELGVIGRPAILVPLPGAIDNDQLGNARSFADSGAGFVIEQKDTEFGRFSNLLQELLEAPERLKEAAAAALRHGRPDAATRLAALVETIIAA